MRMAILCLFQNSHLIGTRNLLQLRILPTPTPRLPPALPWLLQHRLFSPPRLQRERNLGKTALHLQSVLRTHLPWLQREPTSLALLQHLAGALANAALS